MKYDKVFKGVNASRDCIEWLATTGVNITDVLLNKFPNFDHHIVTVKCQTSEKLRPMNQYHFDRDYFTKTIKTIIPELLDIMADNGYDMYTDNFHLFRFEDEVYVLHLKSGTMINWYKNLGRTNTCNKNLEKWEFVEFLKLLKKELGDQK